jgi:hypothetical protein
MGHTVEYRQVPNSELQSNSVTRTLNVNTRFASVVRSTIKCAISLLVLRTAPLGVLKLSTPRYLN